MFKYYLVLDTSKGKCGLRHVLLSHTGSKIMLLMGGESHGGRYKGSKAGNLSKWGEWHGHGQVYGPAEFEGPGFNTFQHFYNFHCRCQQREPVKAGKEWREAVQV